MSYAKCALIGTSYFDGGVAYILYLLYSPDLCHCIKAFSEGDHRTAVTLLPQLQRHNNILCRHPYSTTYLVHRSAYNGWKDITELLITTYNCDSTQKDRMGWTALHHAACGGHIDIVRYLVENSNCVRENTGYTPLHHAAREGRIDIVRCLVENCNCDVNARDSTGCTPLHHAAHEEHIDIVRCLVENSNCVRENTGYTPLHHAAREGRIDIVRCLVENCNCDVNARDSTGCTPLHHAACEGHTDIVRCLVKNSNCDVNVRNNTGYTPLHHAAHEEHIDIVRCLVKNSNCDVNVRNNTGYTPLHHAAHEGHIDIVKCLVEHTAAVVMAIDKYGATPFHLACQHNSYNRNIPVIKYFLSIPVVLQSFTNKTSDYRSPLSGAEGNAATIFHQFERVHISHPVGSFINIFLLGHTGAGKTSLCHVLKERSSFFKIGKFVKGVKTLTAGIVPNKLRDHKSLGNVIVHDFAGQPEYYSSHAAILESLLENCGAVFVVVINLTQDLSQQVRFWSGRFT